MSYRERLYVWGIQTVWKITRNKYTKLIYVKENGRFPIMEMTKSANGDDVIITGDGNGYYIRYTFSE